MNEDVVALARAERKYWAVATDVYRCTRDGGSERIAEAISKTLAKRIANALNIYNSKPRRHCRVPVKESA